jgi:ligand-binding sensor domain-containing protein
MQLSQLGQPGEADGHHMLMDTFLSEPNCLSPGLNLHTSYRVVRRWPRVSIRMMEKRRQLQNFHRNQAFGK